MIRHMPSSSCLIVVLGGNCSDIVNLRSSITGKHFRDKTEYKKLKKIVFVK